MNRRSSLIVLIALPLLASCGHRRSTEGVAKGVNWITEGLIPEFYERNWFFASVTTFETANGRLPNSTEELCTYLNGLGYTNQAARLETWNISNDGNQMVVERTNRFGVYQRGVVKPAGKVDSSGEGP